MQTKLREEVINALGDDTTAREEATADLANILKGMPYLNGIIHETFRLYPAVPVSMRESLRDTQIGEYSVPKGTELTISIWQTNRSPEAWGADAGECRPERWINAEDGKPNRHGGAQNNYDFATFLHGPRSCIGQEFAKVEMRCLLAGLVSSFTWDLAMDDKKVIPMGVMFNRPGNGMYLKLKPRA